MTRRDWLVSAAGLLVEAKKVSAQTTLSTEGDFLDWSNEEKRYWFYSAQEGLERLRRLAYAHADVCALQEIARSATGLPVYALRLGRGQKQAVILSGMHGCEPSGPRGLLAYADALLNASTPFGISAEGEEVLKAITLHVILLLNPGGAQRFSEHFPDSWHGTWFREWTEASKTKFFAEANEPIHFFYGSYVKKPPMRFAPDQIARWEATGGVLGSSLTDQGLDMWFDWDDTHGAETAATKALLSAVRPSCVVDFHNFMYPTEVFAPTVYSHGSCAEEERALALSLQKTWRMRKLLFHDRAPRPYPKPAERYYEDHWFHQLGARTLIVEVNGGMLSTEGAEYEPVPGERALSRRESLETVVTAVDALVKQIAA